MISIQQSITDLNTKIAHVLKKLQSIKTQTLNVNQSIQPATGTTHSEMGTSYAEVTSTGIIKAVHDAVSSSLKVKSEKCRRSCRSVGDDILLTRIKTGYG